MTPSPSQGQPAEVMQTFEVENALKVEKEWRKSFEVVNALKLESEWRKSQREYEDGVSAAKAAPLPLGSTWLEYGGAELEPLLNHTTLIDVRWLLAYAQGEEPLDMEEGSVEVHGIDLPEFYAQSSYPVVPAWQQVPKVAKVQVESLRASRWKGLPIGVLSYGWASKCHPDPTGAFRRHHALAASLPFGLGPRYYRVTPPLSGDLTPC